MKSKAIAVLIAIFVIVSVFPPMVTAAPIAETYLAQTANGAQAKTTQMGAWQWKDISEKLGPRKNRPIWASAWMDGFWYLTDGIPFAQGGRALRTNGDTIEDLSEALQVTGLERVDDIRSNDRHVLFLQDIVRRNGGARVIAYDGKQWEDRTPNFAREDGGVALLEGCGDAWIHSGFSSGIAMSFFEEDDGKEVIENPDTGAGLDSFAEMLALSTLYQSIEDGKQTLDQLKEDPEVPERFVVLLEQLLSMRKIPAHTEDAGYSVRRNSPAEGFSYLPQAIGCISGGYITAVYDAYEEKHNQETRFFAFGDGRLFTDVTDEIGSLEKIHAVASNGKKMLIAGTASSTSGRTDRLYLYDGKETKDLSQGLEKMPFDNWSRVRIAWNGMSWMILNGKQLMRLDGDRLINMGRTRDLFLTISGSSDGRFLLGGLVSRKEMDGPMEPFLSKLVVVTENAVLSEDNQAGGSLTGVLFNATSTKEPEIPKGINPKAQPQPDGIQFVQPESKAIILRPHARMFGNIVAKSTGGLERIVIFLNEERLQECMFNGDAEQQECLFSIETDRLATGRVYRLYAEAKGNNGSALSTESRYLAVRSTERESEDGSKMVKVIKREDPLRFNFNPSELRSVQQKEILLDGERFGVCKYDPADPEGCEIDILTDKIPEGRFFFLEQVDVRLTDERIGSSAEIYQLMSEEKKPEEKTEKELNVRIQNPFFTITKIFNDEAEPIKIAATGEKGLESIRILLGRETKKTCEFNGETEERTCEMVFSGEGYEHLSAVSILGVAKNVDGSEGKSGEKFFLVLRPEEKMRSPASAGGEGGEDRKENWSFSAFVASEVKQESSTEYVAHINSDGSKIARAEIFAGKERIGLCEPAEAVSKMICKATMFGKSYDIGEKVIIITKAMDAEGGWQWAIPMVVEIIK